MNRLAFQFSFLVLYLFVTINGVLFAQAESPNIKFSENNKALFQHLTLEDGLLQSSIVCIHQDRRGFIWIGTEDGLHKYDGYKFKVFRHIPGDTTSLSNNFVYDITEDTLGNLWIATGYGINRLDTETETLTYFIFEGQYSTHYGRNRIASVVFDEQQNSLWFLSETGLYKIEQYEDLNSIRFLPASTSLPLLYNLKSGTLFLDSKGDLWIRINYLLYKQKKGSQEIQQISDGSDHGWIHTLAETDKQKIWIGADNGVFEISEDNSAQPLEQLNAALPGKRHKFFVRHLFKDKQGNMWLGANTGLYHYNPANDSLVHYIKEYSNPNSSDSHNYTSMMQDHSGLLWFGTFGGINILNINSQRFNLHRVSYKGGPRDKEVKVRSVFEDSESIFWMGTSSGKLYYLEEEQNRVHLAYTVLENNYAVINKIDEDKAGNLWLNAGLVGVLKFDKESQKGVAIGLGKKHKISSLFIDTHENIWVQHNNTSDLVSPLCKYNYTEGTTQFFATKSNKELEIRCIAQDAAGRYWFGTFGSGLYNLDLNTSTGSTPYLTHVPIIGIDTLFRGYDIINYILPDNHGVIWLGTYGSGLVKMDYRKETFTLYNSHNSALPNDIIYGILKDDRGYLWISSNKGISRFNPETNDIWTFSSKNGLQSNEFNSGVCFKNKKGKMYFGGINGVNSFWPDKIEKSEFHPPIVFTEFQINNKVVTPLTKNSPLEKQINETDTLMLNYLQSDISFSIAALDYFIPENNQFSYSFVKEDESEKWDTIGNRSFLGFTNITPGKYTLRVNGTNHDGVWNLNEHAKSITIIMSPPWWNSQLAYLIYAILLILFLLFVNRFIQKLRTEKKEREEEKLKSKLISNITHEFRTPLTVIMGMTDEIEKQPKEAVKIIKRNSAELLGQVNQMLELIQLDYKKMEVTWINGNVVPYLKYLGESFESYAKTKGIALSVYSENEEIMMDYDEEKLNRIIPNLLSNAIKFSDKGGKVIFHFRQEKDFLIIKVKDHGIGISKDQLGKVFKRFYQIESSGLQRKGTGLGLVLVKEVTELLGGTVQVKSEVGKWTEFEVRLPIRNQYKENKAPDIEKPINDLPILIPSEQLCLVEESISGDKQAPIILLIEDNEDLLHYLNSCFEGDFDIAIARDGEEGVKKAFELIPDIIISDIMMPLKDGFAVCDELTKDMRTNHIPIILLTAKVLEKEKQLGLDLGAVDYLTKPFKKEELVSKVQNQLFILKNKQRIYNVERSNKHLAANQNTSQSVFLQQLYQILEKNIDNEDFKAPYLAKALFMSEATLYRKLKAVTGLSIGAFIEDYRFSKAIELLQNTELTITQISQEVGFKSLEYFSKRFKEKIGKAPSELRK